MIQMQIDSGSFRDPSGRIFVLNGRVYRSIFAHGMEEFAAARDSGAYDRLMAAGLLLSHEEVNAGNWAPEGALICLRHPRIPMVSYPWEWPFSLLKDAALIHLDAMLQLVPEGFWLRDASAFNIQYDGVRLRLIDTLSVGRRIPDSPWRAYGQFCAHFLGPLALAAYSDIRLLSLWRNYMDGFPLDLVVKMLPFVRKHSPGLFMHLRLHARVQSAADKKKDIGRVPSTRQVKVSDRGLIGIVRSLRRTIEGINWKSKSEIWDEYGEIRTYDAEDVARKSEYVDRVVHRLQPKLVWDLGANTGEFSLIAASHGAFVVSIDGDPACTEALYQKVFGGEDVHGILPLTMDLANPSPGLGWNGKERLSLGERGPADLVMALALIHHLVLSACVPLEMTAQWLSTLGKHLLVEFVPPQDPMVKRLLHNRGGDHLPYDLDQFEKNFGTFFDLEDRSVLKNGRILFLYERSKKVV
ncbi:MAG: SAM-dependent methyltransferase [Thermodesulfobacteriota bacterium]